MNDISLPSDFLKKATEAFCSLSLIREGIEQQSHSRFEEALVNLIENANTLEFKIAQKQKHYSHLLQAIGTFQIEIDNQAAQESDLTSHLMTNIESMEKGLLGTQSQIQMNLLQKEITLNQQADNKIESFLLKNRGAWDPDVLKEDSEWKVSIEFLKKQDLKVVQSFRKKITLIGQEGLNDLKRLKAELGEVDCEESDLMQAGLKQLHAVVRGEMLQLESRRQSLEEGIVHALDKMVNKCV